MPEQGVTVGEARRQAASRLQTVSETADLDAELLVRAVLGVDRTELFLQEPEPIGSEDAEQLEALVQRRLDHEPMAYILHRAPFRNLVLYVDERVLVPRPETEELVQIALDWLARRDGPQRVADVGAGSGAIALALASELGERADVDIVATDTSSDALHVAAINRERLGMTSRVRLVRTHLLDGLEGRFNLVLANLPYLRLDQRDPSTEDEPDAALYAGEDGFDLYRELLDALPHRMGADGLFVGEIDPDQAELGIETVEQKLSLPARVVKDTSGRDRFLLAGRET